MPDVLFVQGAGPEVHEAWDRKLVESLESQLGPSYRVRYPRMPDEADPHYATWKVTLLPELAALDDRAILVGHSIGGTILLHVLAELAEHRAHYRALVLIAAPFIGDGGWPSDEMAARTSFELPMPVVLFHGAADEDVSPAHVQLYARAIAHATVHVLPERDHQLNNDLGDVARTIRSLVR